METLVLSSDWRPIYSVSWQDAISIVYTERAEILAEYEDRVIRSAKDEFFMPSVIRFRSGKPPKIMDVKFSKHNLFIRDKGKCQYCNKCLRMAEATLDHVLPKSRRGPKSWNNIVISCRPCNNKKRDRTPEEANMALRQRPRKPEQKLFSATFGRTVPDEWRPFLGKSYG